MDETQGHPEPSASELLAKYLRRPSVLLPLLGLVTFVVYSGSLSFDFYGMTGSICPPLRFICPIRCR